MPANRDISYIQFAIYLKLKLTHGAGRAPQPKHTSHVHINLLKTGHPDARHVIYASNNTLLSRKTRNLPAYTPKWFTLHNNSIGPIVRNACHALAGIDNPHHQSNIARKQRQCHATSLVKWKLPTRAELTSHFNAPGHRAAVDSHSLNFDDTLLLKVEVHTEPISDYYGLAHGRIPFGCGHHFKTHPLFASRQMNLARGISDTLPERITMSENPSSRQWTSTRSTHTHYSVNSYLQSNVIDHECSIAFVALRKTSHCHTIVATCNDPKP